MVRPLFVAFIQSAALPMLVWQYLSWLTIDFELFLAFALLTKKLRKVALILGTLFHIAIVAFLIDYIITFSLVMLTGYLAFIDRKQDAENEQTKGFRAKPVEFGLALSFIVAMILIPMRIYWWPGRPADTIVQFDRAPWTYNMFVLRADTTFLLVTYKDGGGLPHWIEPTGRMKVASSDNELYAMRDYVFANYPGAREMHAQLKLRINDRWDLEKTLDATAGGATTLTVKTQH
jgi:hypothetical protein